MTQLDDYVDSKTVPLMAYAVRTQVLDAVMQSIAVV